MDIVIAIFGSSYMIPLFNFLIKGGLSAMLGTT